MKRLSAVLALLMASLLLFAACDVQKLQPPEPFRLAPYKNGDEGVALHGGGEVQTKTLALPERMNTFSLEVEVGISFRKSGRIVADLIIDESLKERAVVLEADGNIAEAIHLNLDEGISRISIFTKRKALLTGPATIQIRIGAPVKHLIVNGTWKVTYDCPSITNCDIKFNGAANGDFRFDTLKSLDLIINGAGSCRLFGTARDTEIELNGAANVKAFELISQEASVEINGAGSCEITAEQKLEIDLSGVGSVTYAGDPELDQDIKGIGTVRKR